MIHEARSMISEIPNERKSQTKSSIKHENEGGQVRHEEETEWRGHVDIIITRAIVSRAPNCRALINNAVRAAPNKATRRPLRFLTQIVA